MKPVCITKECENTEYAKGLCVGCYQNARYHADPKRQKLANARYIAKKRIQAGK